MTGTSHGMNWLESRGAFQVSLLVLSFLLTFFLLEFLLLQGLVFTRGVKTS